jgi:hypothetical protein
MKISTHEENLNEERVACQAKKMTISQPQGPQHKANHQP